MEKDSQLDGQKDTDWIALAKIAQESFFNRRALEWKLSLGFWAGIAAFSWVFFSVDGLTIPHRFNCYLGIGYAVLFVLTIPFWHLPLQKAHGGDKRYFFYYLKRARGIEDPKFREGKGTWEDVDKVWFFGHLLFTVFFLSLSWYVITAIAVPTANAKAIKKVTNDHSPNHRA
jgi:hypothetical protein